VSTLPGVWSIEQRLKVKSWKPSFASITDEDLLIHRTFADEEDRLWEVWEVSPSDLFQLQPVADVREEVAECAPVGEWARGWLTFHSGSARRRLAPVPEHWERTTDAELLALLGCAERFNDQ